MSMNTKRRLFIDLLGTAAAVLLAVNVIVFFYGHMDQIIAVTNFLR